MGNGGTLPGRRAGPLFAYLGGAELDGGARATWVLRREGERVEIGRQVPLGSEGRSVLDLHFLLH